MYATVRLAAAAAAGAAVAAAGALAAPRVPWAVWAGAVTLAVAAAAASDVVRAPDPRAMKPVRDVPPALWMGREVSLGVQVRNPSPRRAFIGVRDAAPPSMRRSPVRSTAAVEAGARHVFESTVNPVRRGDVLLGPLTVRAGGPLGLAGRQATVALTQRVRVYPALPGRAEVELRIHQARLLQTGERSAAVRGGGTEFDALREYHPDDEFRRINWRATARARRAISNVYREERNQQVMLLVDAGRTMAATVAGFSRFEHALDGAMAVAEMASRAGDHTGGVAFGRDILALVPPRGGRAQSRRILDAMFAIEPQLSAPGYSGAFATVLSRFRRRSLLVLLTELQGPAAMESLLSAVPALLSRHLMIVGSVTDPEVEAAALARPAGSEAVYLKAAAAEALAARDATAGRLRRMGAVVVDLPPGKLAGRLVDEYLRIKAYGRL